MTEFVWLSFVFYTLLCECVCDVCDNELSCVCVCVCVCVLDPAGWPNSANKHTTRRLLQRPHSLHIYPIYSPWALYNGLTHTHTRTHTHTAGNTCEAAGSCHGIQTAAFNRLFSIFMTTHTHIKKFQFPAVSSFVELLYMNL